MKGWVGGLVIGVVLGGAVTGAARGTHWQSADNILTLSNVPSGPGIGEEGYGVKNILFQLGYVEGVDDALVGVRESGVDGAWLQRQAICLHAHSGGNVFALGAWAFKTWRENVNAGRGDWTGAIILIVDACK
jgi:hypothetical protein